MNNITRKKLNLKIIESYTKLKQGWDSFGHGEPLRSGSKEKATWLINNLTVQPEVFITMNGVIQFNYNFPNYYIEIELDNDFSIFYTEFDDIEDEFKLIGESDTVQVIKEILDYRTVFKPKQNINKENLTTELVY